MYTCNIIIIIFCWSFLIFLLERFVSLLTLTKELNHLKKEVWLQIIINSYK